MADSYVSVTWVANELVTSTKLNQAMTNDSGFHDGTALGDGIIVTRHLGTDQVTIDKIPNRTRRILMQMGAEGTGGATTFNNYGQEVRFASGGNPSGFARGALRVPKDYVSGTSANLIILAMMNATQSMSWRYYVESLAVGDDGITSPWNVASNLSTASQSFTAKIVKEISINITSGNLATDKLIGVAVRPDVVLSADMEVLSMAIDYTADS